MIEILGPASDAIVAEIIATGISRQGLVAARDRVINDRKAHHPGPALDPGAFAQVVDILERSRGLFGESGSTLE
ncbi:MAG TPA: hypothetical protein VH934_02590 [Xanthobacteraceae bacterium]